MAAGGAEPRRHHQLLSACSIAAGLLRPRSEARIPGRPRLQLVPPRPCSLLSSGAGQGAAARGNAKPEEVTMARADGVPTPPQASDGAPSPPPLDPAAFVFCLLTTPTTPLLHLPSILEPAADLLHLLCTPATSPSQSARRPPSPSLSARRQPCLPDLQAGHHLQNGFGWSICRPTTSCRESFDA